MQVNLINSQQPAFGMKYVNPRKWHPVILETLMDSPLVKEIDSKYPKAEAVWEAKSDIDSEYLTYYDLKIALAKDKVVTFFYRNKLKDNFNLSIFDCVKKIKNSTLDDLERVYIQKQLRIQAEAKRKATEKAKSERIYARAEASNAELEQNAKTKKIESVEERTSFAKLICKFLGIK